MRVPVMVCGLLITFALCCGPADGGCPDGTTIRITSDEEFNEGATWGDISDDGAIVVYTYDDSIYVHVRHTGQTTAIAATGTNFQSAISGNGRYVAFGSDGSYDPAHPSDDFHYYVYDRVDETYEMVTLDINDEPAAGFALAFGRPCFSYDGRYLAFESSLLDLVPIEGVNPGSVFVRDRDLNQTSLASATPAGDFSSAAAKYANISDDGRFVAFVGDADDLVADDVNGFSDTFLHDRQNGETALVSVATDGTQGDNDSRLGVALSNDGRYVAFHTYADNFFPDKFLGASDLFLRDTVANTTTLISISTDGKTGQNGFNPRMTPDGAYVAFLSVGEELVDDDRNLAWDVFLYDRAESTVELISRDTDGQQQFDPGNINIGVNFYTLGLTADGRTVTWSSGDDDLADGSTTNLFDLYLRRMQCPACPGDVHPPAGDGAVATTDLLALFGAWGSDDPTFDIAPPPDGDGIVDVVDFLLLLGAWGDCP